MIPEHDQLLKVRMLTAADYEDVVALQRACFPDITPWTEAEFCGLVERFPRGQIGVEMDGALVAASAAIVVTGEDWEREHTFEEIFGGPGANNHEPDGDTLYGLDIVVDPQRRGLRLARRMYERRKRLIAKLDLRAMFIAGRLPGLIEHAECTPEMYVRRVVHKEILDPVLTAQLANGFGIECILPGYLGEDRASRGVAVLMSWVNPDWVPRGTRGKRRVRVGAVQFRMRPIERFEDFARQCAFFADAASDYRADFLLYPELLTNQLLSLVPAERPALSARRLSEFTERYMELFRGLAIKHCVNIVGGSHLEVEGDRLFNIAYLFHRDGRIDKQYKIHITPSESKWWGVCGGDEVGVFETDCGKVAILICYDVEFPELARIARAKGADILFVPYNTDLRSAHVRVRTCAHARCIENNLYVVLAGACGNLPSVDGSDIHYAHSAVLTPSDIPFPRDGIGAQADGNNETMVVHELDMALLRRMRRQGAVRTWIDRRTDRYGVFWEERGERREA